MAKRRKDPKVILLEDQFQQQLKRFERSEAKLRRACKAWDKEGRKLKRLLKRLCDAQDGAEERYLQLGSQAKPSSAAPQNGGAK